MRSLRAKISGVGALCTVLVTDLRHARGGKVEAPALRLCGVAGCASDSHTCKSNFLIRKTSSPFCTCAIKRAKGEPHSTIIRATLNASSWLNPAEIKGRGENMLSNRILRFISTSNVLWQSSNKSLLAELRKKTGYTFANCKKALELHDNNLEKAEIWLKEQAQAMGWSKAQKLQGRSTSQGLIAAMVDKGHGVLVEINCETDFVARNKQFHGLADTVASAVLNHIVSVSNGSYHKLMLDADALKALQAEDGKSVADHSALTIGNLGENIGVRRALCMNVPKDVLLAGFTHPASTEIEGHVSCGRYGALLAFKTQEDPQEIGKQLCQHVIGMKPTKIGNPELDQPNNNSDDETTLIHQEFLLDPSLTINQLLKETNTQVIDFARFEMGEVVEGQQNLDAVEVGG